MAVSLKTVAFAFPRLESIVNNTLSNFGQITITLPETGKVFKSCFVEFSCNDAITATGGTLTTKTSALRLGAAAYTTIANANTLTHSAENLSLAFTQDFTAHFVTNFTGSVHTCDFQVQINQSTGTTVGMMDASAILYITYEYEDTSAEQVKTVWIPFTSRLGALSTTKTAFDTVPALDTFCAEAGKTYLNHALIIEGNENNNGTTTDFTITYEFDAAGPITSANHETALASDRLVRQIDEVSAYMTPASTRVLNLWGSVAKMHTVTVMLMVTYTFTLSGTTRMTVSVILPMEIDSPMGGTAATDAQRANRDFFVPESGVITTLKSAAKLYWSQNASISNLYFRAGSQAYNTYTQIAANTCGGCCLQRTVDDNLSLIRGKNTLQIDVYRSSTSVFGWSACTMWYLNYQCDVPADGIGRANHTVFSLLRGMSTGGAATNFIDPAEAPAIPETDYFINSVGQEVWTQTSGTGAYGGLTIRAERLAAEGGQQWEQVLIDAAHTDPETGRAIMIAQARALYKRFPGDLDAGTVDIETARRRQYISLSALSIFWMKVMSMLTYHSITYPVAGNVSGSDGGTVTIELIRAGVKVKSTSRVGDGAYSMTWYPDGQEVYTVASDVTGNQARSKPEIAL